ncbi:hypothetical protein F2981_31550 (plasmid) [Sinorhizobium meliloti]|nr:hypothetical protein [Sinorhizobium meliloti]
MTPRQSEIICEPFPGEQGYFSTHRVRSTVSCSIRNMTAWEIYYRLRHDLTSPQPMTAATGCRACSGTGGDTAQFAYDHAGNRVWRKDLSGAITFICRRNSDR